MRQNGEPTVEEILDSIKQVIARDNRLGAAEERNRRETAGVVETHADEETDSGAAPEATSLEPEVLDLAETEEFLPEDDEYYADSAEEEVAPLVTESARSSMRESLAALAMLSEPGAQPQIVRSGETSLEGLVRDLLRPALSEWLDKNLPQIVERMVAAEIKRIAGKKG